MEAREFKNKIYAELAGASKALANPHRLEILELLAQGPRPVDGIARETGLSAANASQHLQTLKNARLVSSEKKGKYSYYALAGQDVYDVWKALRDLGFARNAEIGRLLADFREHRENLESVSAQELLDRVRRNEAMILDVRPREEYESGHITSARSIPHDRLVEELQKLPKDKEIVAYCRGPLCAMADEAVELLHKKGYRARKLREGYSDWAASGYPVE